MMKNSDEDPLIQKLADQIQSLDDNQSRVTPRVKDEWYKTIVQNALEGFVLINRESDILDVNDSFCRKTGYSRDELLTMKLGEIQIEIKETSINKNDLFDAHHTGNRYCTGRHRCKDGHLIDFQASYKALGEYFYYFYRDVTRQKEIAENLEKTKEEFRTLFENAPVSIWELDYSEVKKFIDELRGQGITNFYKYFTEKPEAFLHCVQISRLIAMNKAGRVTYQDDEDFLEDYHSWARRLVKVNKNLNIWRDSLVALIEGKKRYRLVSSSMTLHGEKRYLIHEQYLVPGYEATWDKVIIVDLDITEQKKAEEKLKEHQEHLEDLIKQRTIELEQAKERAEGLYVSEQNARQELQAQVEQRISFTRALVHELKTPLTPMLAASDLLSQTAKDGATKNMAELIYGGASMLNERIDELLDVARGEIGMLKLECEPCDFLAIVKEVSQYTAYMFLSRNQVFSLEAPDTLPAIRADVQRIRQVLINLLDNASKYTQKGGAITLRVIRHPYRVTVEVEDNGLGITPEKQKDLFSLYRTLAVRGQSNKGIGLGLALSKMLIDLHGGKIWVGNNPSGRGCLFGISLPYEGSEQ